MSVIAKRLRRPAPERTGAGRLITRSASGSTAGADLAGRDTLTQVGLRHPSGVENVLQVRGGDRVRRQKDRADAVPARGLEDRGVLDLAHIGVAAELRRSLARGLAEETRVLPNVDRLRPERDAVEGGLVAVLAGHRHLAGEALRGEGGNHAAGHAVVLREDRVDAVLVRGEDLLHVRLGLRR